MKKALIFRKEFKFFFNFNNYLLKFYIKFLFYDLNRVFFLLHFLRNVFFVDRFLFFSDTNYKFIKFINYFFFSFNSVFFFLRFFVFRLFKSHGINMRVIRGKNNYVFFRVGTSHGFFVRIPSNILLRSFRKRYFFVLGSDFRIINFFSYHFRFFRKFFRYKLIGIKYVRDIFKIKVGKKKAF